MPPPEGVPAATVQVTVDPPDGPPPPPHVRARRRRRALAWAVAALVVIGVPLGLAVARWTTDDPDQPGAAARDDGAAGTDRDDGDAAPDGGSDGEAAPEAGEDADPGDGRSDDPGEARPDPSVELEPPDLAALSGIDLVFGQLLIDIDASERTMIAFQDDLGAAIRGSAGDPDGLFDRIRAVAADSHAQLLSIRSALAEEVDDPGAELVRERYLAHLDAWAAFMAAVEEDPDMLAADQDGGYTVSINATADAFTRALEAELPDGIDAEVARFADEILDRGFRGFGEAQV